MKIEKILNNNVVLTLTEDNEEMVVMGRGIAFQRKQGDEIELARVEKTFVPEKQETTETLSRLFAEMDPAVIELSTDIIKYAQGLLGVKLSNNIYLTLTDHLNYAISRTGEGIAIRNPLTWEIRKFYKVEFEIGLKALDNIQEKLGLKLSEDEAASIALHIVNARQDGQELSTTIKMTEIVQDILSIVRLHFGIVYDEESFHYTRFVTHLQYFARRLLGGEDRGSNDDFLYDQVKVKYPKAYACTEKINDYLMKTYHAHLTKDEQVYLVIHIQRVTEQKNLNHQ